MGARRVAPRRATGRSPATRVPDTRRLRSRARTAPGTPRGVARATRPASRRGILTNFGGTVHQLDLPAPPNGNVPLRFIQGLYVEPNHANHVYAVFNGFSRRWTNTFSAGEGHVFESNDGGVTGQTSAETCPMRQAMTSCRFRTAVSSWPATSA